MAANILLSLFYNPNSSMKIVIFIKDHVAKKKGEKALVTPEQANYFVLCGVASIEEDQQSQEEAEKPKKKKKEA
jgi:hypothetical protein